MAESFRSFINGLVGKAGSASAVAEAIGMSLSAFQRGVMNNGSLGVAACLRLAKFSGTSPTTVLRLAKKSDVADLCEELFGPERSPISGRERELIERWQRKSPEAQDVVLDLLDVLPDAAARENSRRRA